ncbi:hypothetical protein CASFOL_038454 [Castilleja foliolosa]|uniref:Exocyst subunit Exo70 family protein n=1 Tax=Castilleja foliolosa TaxID=1961234 RepID=A0ABD3BL15_9LAMI
MGESNRINHFLAARDLLKSSIEISRNIAISIDKSTSRLKQKSHNLPFLQAALNDIARKSTVHKIGDHLDRAIGPSASILKILDLVYELQDSLETNSPRDDCLFAYIANIKRLQETLKLLGDNCRLVSLWLDDIMQILENEDWYFVKLSKVMKILDELQGKQESGVLSSAFDKLEREYMHILTENQDSPFPIEELQGIIEVLANNNRLERCVCIYAEARIKKVRAALKALDVEYLEIQLSETVSVQIVESYIDRWDEHMEFAVRHLLHKEHKLCNEVFESADVKMSCFAKIATQCGFTDVFHFGSEICKCKKEAIKLLSLLKIFSTLDKLRLLFNDMFDGKFCVEIRNRTRDLLKNVIDGTCEIFCELSVQVELQRATCPPPDGDVLRLVCFVAEYCNRLLEDENKSILVRVLEIYSSNDKVEFEDGDGLLSFEIHNVMKALEINLETWATSYNDKALSYLFMMVNHWYLFNTIRGTKLGDLMGDSWLWAYYESMDYYADLYMRESWEKITVLLRDEGLTLFPNGRAVDRNLAKKRIHLFCEAFDNVYTKQSKWVLYDKALRWKTRLMIVEAIVPRYKSYLQRFMEYEIDEVKYSGERLESLIGSMFEPRIGKYGDRSKCTDMVTVKNADLNHYDAKLCY